MWINIKKVAVLCGLAIGSVGVSAHAQQVGQGVTPTVNVVTTLPLLSNSTGITAIIGSQQNSSIRLQPNAVAPQLTRELVFAVYSSLYGGWEYMTTVNQLSTVGTHGGTYFRVVVQEIGYGGVPTARMGGLVLPSSAEYQDQTICISGNYYVFPCAPGNTVVGYMRYFNIDGYQANAYFTYRNTSLNSPYTTLSTSIFI